MFFLEITDGGTFTDDDMLVKYFCRIYYDSSFIAILLLGYGSAFVNKYYKIEKFYVKKSTFFLVKTKSTFYSSQENKKNISQSSFLLLKSHISLRFLFEVFGFFVR
jgi:hypothetical protein